MIQQYKRDALIGVPIGSLLFGGSLLLAYLNLLPPWLTIIMSLCGFLAYVWGCLALAKGKGYSTAIVLTVILGFLFPAVVLLALPDKNRRHRRRPPHQSSSP